MGSQAFTVADLHALPDDGRRQELLDGALLVTPTPGTRHQKIVGELLRTLDAACPDDECVLPGPFAVRPSDRTELRPGGLVGRLADFTEECIRAPPLLVFEVLDEHTALVDRHLKRAAYERMGVPSYWVIDPTEPMLTVFEFGADGLYEVVAEVKGDEAYEARLPCPVRIVPSELLGTLRR